jgi:hypothetical protein
MTSPSPDLNLALRGFFADKQWPLKVMIGAFINCSAVALFNINPIFAPICFAFWGLNAGYSLRALRAAVRGDLTALPSWDDPVDLLVSGLSWLSIYLGFSLFILSILVLSLTIASTTTILHMTNPAFLPWAEGTFIGLFLLLVFFGFFLSALMANFADEEKMLAGFAWRKVFKRIIKAPVPLIAVWLCGATLSFLAVFVPTITVVLGIIVPFSGFLANLISLRMAGQIWAATGRERQQNLPEAISG